MGGMTTTRDGAVKGPAAGPVFIGRRSRLYTPVRGRFALRVGNIIGLSAPVRGRGRVGWVWILRPSAGVGVLIGGRVGWGVGFIRWVFYIGQCGVWWVWCGGFVLPLGEWV